jgi:hypothetical protein
VCLAAVSLAGSAWAQDKGQKPDAAAASPQQGGMDMSKMGPATRQPTNEKQTRKEVEDFFKRQEAAAMKGDFNTNFDAVDYPVYMITDDAKGVPHATPFSREEYTAMMRPFYENMPKDMKMTHKPTIVVLSDSLVSVTDDFTVTMGKQKMTGRNANLLVKRDGQWKWKMMAEAGWGGMSPPSGGTQAPAGGNTTGGNTAGGNTQGKK